MAEHLGIAENALSRIAVTLGDPTAGAKPKSSRSTKSSEPPVDTIQPFPRPVDPLRQREELSAQIYYSMRVPTVTPMLLFDMEAHFPGLVSFLASLQDRPASRAELKATIDGLTENNQNSTRADEDPQRLEALANVISHEAFGDPVQRNPGVAVAGLVLAAFMAAYTIQYNWHRPQ